ncbi:hypothetical protein SPI_00791 [Niveomyces insectorum RCEF 264]|uniref:Uncharacterized protein n=1 Tax=Niveomyces insectorum RCEF 264 TaxID=1081102 RepID=A0A168ADB4_9HYPO|nr:hypothetical protein SPI_00791 [Niveomyces insectorum RCEF 264]
MASPLSATRAARGGFLISGAVTDSGEGCAIRSQAATGGSATSRCRRMRFSSFRAADGRRCFATKTTATLRKQASAENDQKTHQQRHESLPDLDKVVTLVNGARDRILGHAAIPSEEETAAALSVCAEAAALIMDTKIQPQLSSIDHQADTAASALLSFDGTGSKRRATAAATTTTATDNDGIRSGTVGEAPSTVSPLPGAPPWRLRNVVSQISDAAYAIVEEPRVFITPQLLAQYVAIQARLGRPESLPHVLQLYATKPLPRIKGSSGNSITFVPQNPNKPSNAVDADVAAAALDAALASKNLDAAVGVVEHTYAAPAFVRAKLLRKGLLPAFVVLGVPVATYSLASQLAAYQQTMDPTTATGLAFAGMLAYIGFTGTIGVVANTTANDQMRRVTWAPGTPLRERWLREDERAALDTVACAFGFSEAHRYGEEEGAEFQALREYIMRKDMLLDQIELMEGMSS